MIISKECLRLSVYLYVFEYRVSRVFFISVSVLERIFKLFIISIAISMTYKIYENIFSTNYKSSHSHAIVSQITEKPYAYLQIRLPHDPYPFNRGY